MKFLIYFSTLNRTYKQLILMFADLIIFYFSIYCSFALRFNSLFPHEYLINNNYILIYFYPLIVIPLFVINGLYRTVLKHIGYKTFLAAFNSISISSMVLFFSACLYNMRLFSLDSILAINWFITLVFTLSIRVLAQKLLYNKSLIKDNIPSIAIYGAGEAGVKLANSIQNGEKYNLKFFFDDNKSKSGTVINSIKVFSPDKMKDLIYNKKISMILLAIPSSSKQHRRKLLNLISQHPVKVMELPSVENIIDGKVTINDIKDVDVTDVLNRKQHKPIKNLLDKNIFNKNVLVTGAGGSIGSELCRQILNLKPSKLVLFDLSEYNLYSIDFELRRIKTDSKIITILGSVTNKEKLKNIYLTCKINTIYHAAAYKHVPMIESNPCSGIYNNILGTYYVASEAVKNNVETVVLISTDKAVRPTSVMGATKRFSELILQALDYKNQSETILSMVRFGNVLDSAGSVLPLFRKQIKEGGPVTVTDPEIYRYFMSIPEAVELVLQAGSMASGGDVFVLDMGEPVNILDMAKKMIYLSGFNPKFDNHDGDIEIKITGLRPGEKLFEELLIGNNPEKTQHPNIMKAKEKRLSFKLIEQALNEFLYVCKKQNESGARDLLLKYVEGYYKG